MSTAVQRPNWFLRAAVLLLCLLSGASAWYLNTVVLQPQAIAKTSGKPQKNKSTTASAGSKKAAAVTPRYAGDSTPTPPAYTPAAADPLPDVQLLRFVLKKGKEGIPVL